MLFIDSYSYFNFCNNTSKILVNKYLYAFLRQIIVCSSTPLVYKHVGSQYGSPYWQRRGQAYYEQGIKLSMLELVEQRG